MTIAEAARLRAPILALAAGSTALAAAATYGALRIAGNSPGTFATDGLAQIGSASLLIGPAIGGVAALVAARVTHGRVGAGWSALLAGGAGLAGAATGVTLARSANERDHADEYAQQRARIDAAAIATQQMFMRAGATSTDVAPVPMSYDRAHFGAEYQPPIGPFRNEIVVGRRMGTGIPLGSSTDTIAHEYAHMVVHRIAPALGYQTTESRALQESLADTFAMAVDTDDWLMGEDSEPGGVRSIEHPELRGAVHDGHVDRAPITRSELDGGTEEHLGAGVGNKVAWRIGSQLGRDTMAGIYVGALQSGSLGGRATYSDLAAAVRKSARSIYGPSSREAAVVDAAWTTAGY